MFGSHTNPFSKLVPGPAQRSSITPDFNQLATDLKGGNTTAAPQDFTKLQQDFQAQQDFQQYAGTNGHISSAISVSR